MTLPSFCMRPTPRGAPLGKVMYISSTLRLTGAASANSTRNVAVTSPADFASTIIAITSFMPLPSQLAPLTSWIVAPTGTAAAADVGCTRSTMTLPSFCMRPTPRGAPLGNVMRISSTLRLTGAASTAGAGCATGCATASSRSPGGSGRLF